MILIWQCQDELSTTLKIIYLLYFQNLLEWLQCLSAPYITTGLWSRHLRILTYFLIQYSTCICHFCSTNRYWILSGLLFHIISYTVSTMNVTNPNAFEIWVNFSSTLNRLNTFSDTSKVIDLWLFFVPLLSVALDPFFVSHLDTVR